MSSADGELLPPSTACRQHRVVSDGAQVDIIISKSRFKAQLEHCHVAKYRAGLLMTQQQKVMHNISV